MKVEPKRLPVRHNGKTFKAGESFEIEQKDYEKIQAHVNVITSDEPLVEKPIEKMTLPELKVHAEKHEIDLGEATKKEDILAAILAAGDPDGNQ